MAETNLILGIIIAIIAFAMLNIGMVLEKKGADQLPKIENTTGKQNLKNFLTNKTWLVGWILTTLNWYVFLIALTMAPISLLNPMMGVGMIILVIFSYYYLKEPIAKKEIFGVLVIIAGIVILGVTTSETTAVASPTTLPEAVPFFERVESIVFTIVTFVVIGTAMLISKLKNFKFGDIIFGASSGIMMGIGSTYSKGFVLGINNTFFSTTIANFAWWIFLAVLFVGNMGGMVVQQMGFQHGKAVIVAPLSSVGNLVFGVLGGIFVFREWEGISSEMFIFKLIALIAIVIGVAILSFSRSGRSPAETTTTKPPAETSQ